jgi:hypothetical protein
VSDRSEEEQDAAAPDSRDVYRGTSLIRNRTHLADRSEEEQDASGGPPERVRDFFIDNLLVRIHFIIVMIRWTGLAP